MLRYIHYKGKCFLALLLVFGVILINGCSSDHGGTEVGNPESISPYGIPDSMTTFASTEELETYLKNQYATNVNAYSSGSIGPAEIEIDGEEPFSDTSSSADGGAGAENYTRTNTQEPGVDESDKVKTDGAYFYIAGQKIVSIVQALPADAMRRVSKIDVSGFVESLYLYNNILVILYTPDNGDGRYTTYDLMGPAEALTSYYIPIQAQTGVFMVDVSNPSNPQPIKDIRADGSLSSSRLTGGRLHLVQQFYPQLPPLQLAYNTNDETLQAVVAANREALATVAISNLLPAYEAIDQSGDVVDTGFLVAPTRFYIPDKPCGGSMTAIVTFNLEDPSVPSQSVGVVADAHTIYASTRSLYLTASQYTTTPQTENDITYQYQTVIHKFDLSGETVVWAGSGGVKGHILNQFSLGEYENVLRIATTTDALFEPETPSMNHVFCLEPREQKLEIIGRLENLAPGESIYSARFIGNRGFLVTFEKVDPLFTIDISNPAAPTVVGKLKVPGYSDYIHPLGENHLMTIGKDVKVLDGFPWYQGIQLSIFDISDFSHPTLLYKERIGDRGTESEALYNHKAFTFWEQQGILAIPIDLYMNASDPDDPSQWGEHTFTGVYVYRATIENGFSLIGRINSIHQIDPYDGYYTSWMRGIFIEEHVFTAEESGVRSAEVDDIENTLNTLLFEP